LHELNGTVKAEEEAPFATLQNGMLTVFSRALRV
jgi:hypothetical protein